MAIREYKGARYVMRVAKAGLVHNPANTYEALELVQNSAGETYLSVQPVPAGIPLTNTAYWILTAMTNAQLQQVITDLNSLDTRVTNLETVTKSDLSKVVFIGDSFGHGRTSVGTHTPWPVLTAQLLNIPTNNYYSLCVDGAGFVAGSGANKSFIDLLNTASSDSGFNSSDITAVIIGGGQNDLAYHSVLMNNQTYNIPATITKAKDLFPNAKIFVGMLAHDFLPATANINNSYSNQIDTLKKYQNSALYGAIYISGTENALHRRDMLAPDGIHPIADGQFELALSISMFMQNSNYVPCDVIRTMTIQNPPTGITFQTSEIREVLTPNGVLVGLGDCIINLTSNNYESFQIGTINPNYFSTDTLNLGNRAVIHVQTIENGVTKPRMVKLGLATTNNEMGVYIDFHETISGLTKINIKSQNLFMLPLMKS